MKKIKVSIQELIGIIESEGLGYFLIQYAHPKDFTGTDKAAKEFIATWLKIADDLKLLDYILEKNSSDV